MLIQWPPCNTGWYFGMYPILTNTWEDEKVSETVCLGMCIFDNVNPFTSFVHHKTSVYHNLKQWDVILNLASHLNKERG